MDFITFALVFAIAITALSAAFQYWQSRSGGQSHAESLHESTAVGTFFAFSTVFSYVLEFVI